MMLSRTTVLVEEPLGTVYIPNKKLTVGELPQLKVNRGWWLEASVCLPSKSGRLTQSRFKHTVT